MNKSIHANASTTVAIRRYIQNSSKSTRLLSDELNVSEVTIRKWRKRDFVEDKSHIADNLNTTLSQDDEIIVSFIREFLNLSIDRLLPIVKYFVNQNCSRSALGRLIKRKKLKKCKQLTYIKYSQSNTFNYKLENRNAIKMVIIPFDESIDEMFGLLLLSDTKSKDLRIILLPDSSEGFIINALIDYYQYHDCHLMLISEASAMRNRLINICDKLNHIAQVDCSVYCEQKMDLKFIEVVGKIIMKRIIAIHQIRQISVKTLIKNIQHKYNLLNKGVVSIVMPESSNFVSKE